MPVHTWILRLALSLHFRQHNACAIDAKLSIHIDGGAKRSQGDIILGQLTSVTMRRLSLSVVTLYAGSFLRRGSCG